MRLPVCLSSQLLMPTLVSLFTKLRITCSYIKVLPICMNDRTNNKDYVQRFFDQSSKILRSDKESSNAIFDRTKILRTQSSIHFSWIPHTDGQSLESLQQACVPPQQASGGGSPSLVGLAYYGVTKFGGVGTRHHTLRRVPYYYVVQIIVLYQYVIPSETLEYRWETSQFVL